jgi:hypothetical protein
MRVVEQPETNVVFNAQKDRPNGRDNVVQRNGDHCGYGIAAQKIRHAQRKQRLDSKERCKTNEHPDRHSAGNGMRSISQGNQLCPKPLKMTYQPSHPVTDKWRPCPLPD